MSARILFGLCITHPQVLSDSEQHRRERALALVRELRGCIDIQEPARLELLRASVLDSEAHSGLAAAESLERLEELLLEHEHRAKGPVVAHLERWRRAR